MGSVSPGAVAAGICVQPHPGQSFLVLGKALSLPSEGFAVRFDPILLPHDAGQGAAPTFSSQTPGRNYSHIFKSFFFLLLPDITRRPTGLHTGLPSRQKEKIDT